jgi:hypothetical protein
MSSIVYVFPCFKNPFAMQKAIKISVRFFASQPFSNPVKISDSGGRVHLLGTVGFCLSLIRAL